MAQLHDQLRDRVDRTSEASLTRPGRPPVSLHEHQEIFEAIERADEDGAVGLMREHIVRSGERLHGGAS